MPSSTDTYNGWTNYPTWAVNLWLSNDRGLYEDATERTLDVIRTAETSSEVKNGTWTVEQAQRFNVADMLKDWVCDELAPDLGGTFASDLLGYALGQVDWEEIADAWLEGAREAV